MQKLLYIKLVIVLLIVAAGCTKFPDDINVNPNLPTKASNAQLLTSAINSIASVMEAPTGNLYVQHWSEKPYTDASRYTIVNYDFYGIYFFCLLQFAARIFTHHNATGFSRNTPSHFSA